MANQSDHIDTPVNFARLLDLLNTAEALPETAMEERRQEIVIPAVSDWDFMLPEDSRDLAENPLAAHIVRGMSKIKAG